MVAIALIAAGFLALVDVGITLVWQEPITALIAKFRQDHLGEALRELEQRLPTALETQKLASLGDERARVAFLAGQLERHAHDGSAVGRIRIRRINASYVVVKGTDTEALKSGPGIYSDTRFPGIAGTTAIAGHRTTYLAPFRHINELRRGDTIELDMPYAHFTYTVSSQKVVAPTDVAAAVTNVGFTRLVLSACTPLFSAAKRILVFARLTKTVLVGPAKDLSDGKIAQPVITPFSPPNVLVPLKPNTTSLFT